MLANSQNSTLSELHVKCARPSCRNNALNGITMNGQPYCSAEHGIQHDALNRVLAKILASLDPSEAICELIESDDQVSRIEGIDEFLVDSTSEFLERVLAGPATILQFRPSCR